MHFIKAKYLQKALLTLLLSALTNFTSLAQIGAYLGYATFNTPNNQAFIETYLTFSASHYKFKKNGQGFQSSVNVHLKILKDTFVLKNTKYNVNGPVFYDSLKSPSFIDIQRFVLPNGSYKMIIEMVDNHTSHPKKQRIESTFQINYQKDSLAFSDIELVESYKKAETTSALTKSGIDLVPYSVNFYPESSKELCFYTECYNTNKALGQAKNFLINYYLESEDGKTRLENFGAFKKMQSAEVNPIVGKIKIGNLGTGNYRLVIELRDETNTLKSTKKVYIQRLNSKLEISALQKDSYRQEMNNYFGSCNNTDTLRMFVECLWPIADGVDKDRIINQSIKKDNDLMKKFVIDFWTRRAADTANPINLWARYYRSVQQVMALFRCGKIPAYYTDRGRAYLQYGAPNIRSQQPNEPNTFPYEIWQYYHITDAVNGQSFTNRKFVFVSKNLGDDCYSLVHSDMRGEFNNPRWQFEVTRRNNNGIANPDNNTPAGIETNHFNEIYNNPR